MVTKARHDSCMRAPAKVQFDAQYQHGGGWHPMPGWKLNAVLKELLSHITTHHYKNKKLLSAAIYATALRQLSPVYKQGDITRHDTALHTELNNRFGLIAYAYQAVDTLRQTLIDKLAEHGISDM